MDIAKGPGLLVRGAPTSSRRRHAHKGLANRAPGESHRERGSRSAALPPLGLPDGGARSAGLPVRQSLREVKELMRLFASE